MKPRLPNSDKFVILKAATRLAEKLGRDMITVGLVAKEIGVSRTVLYNHFNDIEDLKNEILANAIITDNTIILTEALIFNNIKNSDISRSAHSKIVEFFK